MSDEILDGTPDASRWLGLNRDTFAATVSVSQAQILAVTEAADELQEQMQRAAATQGTDSTAAEAIDRLEQFRRDAVGIDRVGARGPLRTAKDRLAAAEASLAEVRRQHDEYLERSAAVDAAERRVVDARRAVLRAEAELAHRPGGADPSAAGGGRRAGPSPPRAAGGAGHARRASGRRRRSARRLGHAPGADRALGGPASRSSRPSSRRCPREPVGDREVDPSVHEALRALDVAEAALSALDEEPEEPMPALPQVEEDRVRDLARRLRTPQLPGARGLEQELDAAREAARQARAGAWLPVALAAGVAGVTGAVLLIVDQPAVGVVLLVVAALGAGFAWWTGADARRLAARVARAEAALAPYLAAHMASDRDRAAAAAEAQAAGLPVDPAALDELADRLAASAAALRMAPTAPSRRVSLAARRDAAASALLAALAERGQRTGDDPRAALEAYEAACRQSGRAGGRGRGARAAPAPDRGASCGGAVGRRCRRCRRHRRAAASRDRIRDRPRGRWTAR